MKRIRFIVLAAVLLCALALIACPALAEPDDEPAEWTVLFYFCGSDLESRHSLATGNLQEFTKLYYPFNALSIFIHDAENRLDADMLKPSGKVRLLVQTGGSREWHAQALGMDVDPAALQRWRYRMYGVDEQVTSAVYNGFELVETLPLQSMADPQTLSDFIRWGVQTCPAKKYALVLWDHGDGARSGLFIDELFGNDAMNLYELKQALADGGTRFEALIIDACLMANIETAWNVKDWANWLVASEETVPGKGTAIGEWLKQLLFNPEGDGEWLGRLICDTTCVKYASEAQEAARSTLTWSVIDLSKAGALAEAVDRLFTELGDEMDRYPEVFGYYFRSLFKTEEYGDGQQNMRDLGSLFYSSDLALYSRRSVRQAGLQALLEAVNYCVHGDGRSDARGVSYCYPAGFGKDQLDVYAQNFPMPGYLAYLDAISSWTAPEWVYESARRLPEIDTIDGLKIRMRRRMCEDGMPALMVEPDLMQNVESVCYNLYRLDEETGETVRLGRTNCPKDFLDEDGLDLVWRASDPMHWPAIEGELICMDLIQAEYGNKLYNVPAMIGTEPCVLRCGRRLYDENYRKINEYEIYGVWEGYEINSTLLDRSVTPLPEYVGREYRLMYPVDGTEALDSPVYRFSAPLTMYRALDVAEIPLPTGTYFLEYVIEDVFMRTMTLERIEIHWDGERMTFPEGFRWEDDEWIEAAMGADEEQKRK